MRKKYRTFIDKTALDKDRICISAGVRGEQIILAPLDLIKVTEAQVADLILEE